MLKPFLYVVSRLIMGLVGWAELVGRVDQTPAFSAITEDIKQKVPAGGHASGPPGRDTQKFTARSLIKAPTSKSVHTAD